MLAPVRYTFKRDLTLYWRNKSEGAIALMFFALIACLFPMALGPEPNRLVWAGAGVLWVSALLATLLTLEGLFKSDLEDGTLLQIVLSPHPLSALILGKGLAAWCALSVPLCLSAPLLGTFYGVSFQALIALMTTLLLGTVCLTFIGLIGVALTLSLKRGGLLLGLLVLPLYIPILIFGAGAVKLAQEGLPYSGQLALLGAMALMSLLLAPLAVSGVLKISVH